MRALTYYWIFSGALVSFLWGQSPSNAPAQTIPLPAPTKKETTSEKFRTDTILTPDTTLPEGFTFRADDLGLSKLLSGETTKLETKGDIRVTTNRGDKLRSDRATFDFSEETESRASFFDQVRLRSSDGIEIFANKASIDESDKSINFSGEVSAYQGAVIYRGDSIKYYYDSRKLSTSQLRTAFAPFLLESGRFKVVERNGEKFYKGNNAGITTHDVEHPNFWFRGEEVSVLPGDKVRFENVKILAGDVPIFWLPNLTQKFDGEFNYRPRPGARSNWGPFLLNQYSHDFGGPRDPDTRALVDPLYKARWNVDFYSRRGVGVGLDLDAYSQSSNPNVGKFSAYHIYDFDPSEQRSAEPRLGFDDNQRFILQARQRIDGSWLPGAKQGHLDLNSTLLSDFFFLEDFRTRDFTTDFQPDNTLSLSQQWDDSQLLTVWARFRLNDFYQSDQRLPEIAFDQVRRPIFGTPILHESQNIVGLYRETLADMEEDELRAQLADPTITPEQTSTIENLLIDNSFARVHTYHELSLPVAVGRGLRFTPRVGAGYSRYDGISGPLSSQERGLFHASVDATLKFTKEYPDWISKKWGLNSALHVVQPYATATVLETDDLDSAFRPIDRLTGSTRPRALQPGRFSAIDDLADWQILRLGTRNRILTRRDGASHQWLSLDTYIDIFAEDPEFDRNVSNLYTDLHWSPLPWLDLTVETQVPLFSESNFTEVATGLQFMPNENTEIGFKHRFLQDHPILNDSNRLEFRLYHRFNEEWGAAATHRWEFADSTLEFQQYSLYRNLDSWTFTAGVFTRDNSDEFEVGVLFGFTLTDFPSFSLPLQIDN